MPSNRLKTIDFFYKDSGANSGLIKQFISGWTRWIRRVVKGGQVGDQWPHRWGSARWTKRPRIRLLTNHAIFPFGFPRQVRWRLTCSVPARLHSCSFVCTNTTAQLSKRYATPNWKLVLSGKIMIMSSVRWQVHISGQAMWSMNSRSCWKRRIYQIFVFMIYATVPQRFFSVWGCHPKVVQEMLGHTQISMTMDIYSHELPSMQQDAVSKLNTLLIKREEDTKEEKFKESNWHFQAQRAR